MRFLLMLALALLVVPTGSAQEATVAPHALPFASAGNALELTLGGDVAISLVVAVASAPAWLTFDRMEAAPQAAEGGGEPIARLTFTVARDAPIGVPADIVLTVRAADGSTLGEKTVHVEVNAPTVLSVLTPRPNPSRGAALIPYAIPATGPVRVSVFDLLGREVAVLADATEEAGAHEARLQAGQLAAGIYTVRVVSGGEARVTRLTVVR